MNFEQLKNKIKQILEEHELFYVSQVKDILAKEITEFIADEFPPECPYYSHCYTLFKEGD